VGLTRAKNFCVLFDRNGQQRAPLYHFLRRLGLGSHVTSVLGGGLAGAVRGSLSNNPLEWSKRAANLVEMKLFKLAAQCYGSAGDVLRAAAYGATDILHVSGCQRTRKAGWGLVHGGRTSGMLGFWLRILMLEKLCLAIPQSFSMLLYSKLPTLGSSRGSVTASH